MVIRAQPDVGKTYSHPLPLGLSLEVRGTLQRARKEAGPERANQLRSASVPNYEWPCQCLIISHQNYQENQTEATAKGFPIWFSPLWCRALWMGKMSHYETPECSLLCSKLKGMLLSVWGSPLICEMLCALWKDQAYNSRQYECVQELWCLLLSVQCFVRNV